MIYAGFWRRFLAHVIDSVTISVGLMIILIPLGFLVGGVLVGSDLIDKANERKAQAAQHSQLETVHHIVPLSNRMTLAQALAPADSNSLAPGSATPEPMPTAQPAYPSVATQPYQAPIAPAQVSPQLGNDSGSQINGMEDKAEGKDKLDSIEAMLNIVGAIFGFFAGLFYHPLFIGSKWQATPGKRIMGCVVVSRDGQRITRMHALGRHVACAFSWLPFPPICIGFFLAGWTKQKTALHDMIAGTRVVRVVTAAPIIATK